MSFTLAAKFTETNAPAGASPFAKLVAVVTDSAGTSLTAEATAPTTAADGTSEFLFSFSTGATGPATVVVTAVAADGSTLGTPFTGSGVVPATFPSVISVVFS